MTDGAKELGMGEGGADGARGGERARGLSLKRSLKRSNAILKQVATLV